MLKPREVSIPLPVKHRVQFHADDLVTTVHRDDDPEAELIYQAHITTVSSAQGSQKVEEWGGRITVLGHTKAEAEALRDAVVAAWNTEE
jgi:hypothetical protein